MKNASAVSPQLQQFLAPQTPTNASAPRSAFEAHGIWAYGVVLMRNLRFAAKAALICLMFVIPLAYVTFEYYVTKKAVIDTSSQELMGIDYIQEIFPVLDLAHQYRRDAAAAANGKTPATFDEVKSKIRAAQARLADVESRFGATLGTTKAYADVQNAFNTAVNASPADLFKAHEAHFNALLALMSLVTDNSTLSLDPDLDSYYVMDAALFRMPDIIESTGKLRGTGMAVMRSGAATAAQQQQLGEAIVIAEFQFRNMREGLAKAIAGNPDVAKAVNAQQTLDDTAAIFELARKSVIGGQDYTPENQARYLAAANKASESQNALASRLLLELEALIAKRVSGLKWDLYKAAAVGTLSTALAAYFFIGFFLVTSGGLKLVSRHLIEMSEGDLRRPPSEPLGSDEPAALINDLRVTYAALHGLIRKVRHGARALHGASEEITAASMDLSTRTEASAASLEEQASAMEQIGATVRNTAERANTAATFASDNAHVAEAGGKVFAEMVTTMHDIHASSSRIGDIIGVIDGIAFQTNILALNAAVEAARAGETGRGFAVVASEVRNLARRSAEAAREIKSLISASVEKVEGGTRVVQQAGVSMQTVVDNARKINDSLSEIADSAREQASGVEEIGRAIQEMDRNTQQNAALVEQTSAAAGALSQQADMLQDEIANFRVT